MNSFQKAECTACGQHIEFPADMAGKEVACPSCGANVKAVQPEKRVEANKPIPSEKKEDSSGSGRYVKLAVAGLALVILSAAGIYLDLKAELGKIREQMGQHAPIELKPTEAWDYRISHFTLSEKDNVASAELWREAVHLDGIGNDGWDCAGAFFDPRTREAVIILKKPKAHVSGDWYRQDQRKREDEAQKDVLKAIRGE